MGYTTDFEGSILISPAVTTELRDYINLLAGTRRMKRDVSILEELYNGKFGYNGSYGTEGEFFAKEDGNFGQTEDSSVKQSNYPPSTQPGLWLQWNITEDGNEIEWDQGEKFYDSEEWMRYIINNFLKPNGHICNGEIIAQGEDITDRWKLMVKDNIVTRGDITGWSDENFTKCEFCGSTINNKYITEDSCPLCGEKV